LGVRGTKSPGGSGQSPASLKGHAHKHGHMRSVTLAPRATSLQARAQPAMPCARLNPAISAKSNTRTDARRAETGSARKESRRARRRRPHRSSRKRPTKTTKRRGVVREQNAHLGEVRGGGQGGRCRRCPASSKQTDAAFTPLAMLKWAGCFLTTPKSEAAPSGRMPRVLSSP